MRLIIDGHGDNRGEFFVDGVAGGGGEGDAAVEDVGDFDIGVNGGRDGDAPRGRRMATVSACKKPAEAAAARAIGKATAAGMADSADENSVGEISFIRRQQCRRGESNPYTFRYRILSPARLPIPPLLRDGERKGLERF